MMDRKEIDPTFLIGVFVGLAVIVASILFIRTKKGFAKPEKEKTTKQITPLSPAAPSSPLRTTKPAVGSITTPAGRRSARLARKSAD
eukprot:CCRYP_011757-RB/>CCRYP_011757-RB protein AED:0.39 eAED:0.39 QI:148/1/1/1/0/0/4/1493/86